MGEGLITAQDADRLKEHRIKLQNFIQLLNKAPDKIMTDQKSKYIPISFIENGLDEIFFGQWDLKVNNYQVVANSIAVHVTLKVINPVTLKIQRRDGLGAVPIRLKAGSKPTDFDQIQHDSIQTGLPAAKAYAFKNAVQTLGKNFGRDVSRKEDRIDTYNPIIDNDENPDVLEELKQRYINIAHTQQNIDSILQQAKTNLSKKEINELRVYLKDNYKKPEVKK